MSSPAPVQPLTNAPDVLDVIKPSWSSGVREITGPDGAVYGRLDYAQWSGKALAQTSQGELVISRVKGFGTRQELTDPRTGQVWADVDVSFWSGSGAVVLDGRRYTLPHAFLSSATSVQVDGVELLTIQPGFFALGKDKGDVHLTQAARTDPYASLMILLALDQVIHRQQNHSSGGAAGS